MLDTEATGGYLFIVKYVQFSFSFSALTTWAPATMVTTMVTTMRSRSMEFRIPATSTSNKVSYYI